MNTVIAFGIGAAARAAGAELMVFDWDKAAKLINDTRTTEASAGLCSDWEWTGGVIFKDGKPVVDDYTYLASMWATPGIEIEGKTYDCYIMETEARKKWKCENWAKLKWTESSLNILNGKKENLLLTD